MMYIVQITLILTYLRHTRSKCHLKYYYIHIFLDYWICSLLVIAISAKNCSNAHIWYTNANHLNWRCKTHSSTNRWLVYNQWYWWPHASLQIHIHRLALNTASTSQIYFLWMLTMNFIRNAQEIILNKLLVVKYFEAIYPERDNCNLTVWLYHKTVVQLKRLLFSQVWL